jgi:hypothetical protein
MNHELEVIRKDAVVAYFKYYSGICMEGMRKATK